MRSKGTFTDQESGNVFFMILMAVALFASLAFTFSKGLQQGGENISNRQAALAATDILTHAQKTARAVEATLARGNSETDISFDNDAVTGYENLACDPEKRCEIFTPEGAGLAWQNPPANANKGEPYFFGANQVGLASEAAAPARRDLVMILPVNMGVCTQINNMTTRTAIWTSARTVNTDTPFQGDYETPVGTGITWSGTPNERPAGCVCLDSSPCDGSDDFIFYYVLHSR